MWFTETSSTPIVLCATAGAICAANWFRTQQTNWLTRLIICVVAIVGIFIVERMIVTEGEQIELNIHSMVHAFQRQDRKLTHSFISEKPQAQWIHELVNKGFEWVEVGDDVRITDVSLNVDGHSAESTFRANASLVLKTGSHQGSVGHQPSRWRMGWEKQNGEWKIIAVQRLHVLEEKKLNLFHEGQ